VAVVRDQVRQWVPFVCFYILAALLVTARNKLMVYI
jgi:hypothetical protein